MLFKITPSHNLPHDCDFIVEAPDLYAAACKAVRILTNKGQAFPIQDEQCDTNEFRAAVLYLTAASAVGCPFKVEVLK